MRQPVLKIGAGNTVAGSSPVPSAIQKSVLVFREPHRKIASLWPGRRFASVVVLGMGQYGHRWGWLDMGG